VRQGGIVSHVTGVSRSLCHGGIAVLKTGRSLPIPCPNCAHVGSRLLASNVDTMTLTCEECRLIWPTRIEELPPEIQDRIRIALLAGSQ
jgi:hypothetical protein